MNLKRESSYRPVQFFLLAFLLSWAPWFAAAYCSYQDKMDGCQMLFLLIGLFGPSVSTLILLWTPKDKILRTDFWDKLKFNKINPLFLPILVLIVPGIVFLATFISLGFGLSADQFALTSTFKIMEEHGLLSLLILFLAPTFEELGWRGYGVDSLTSYFNIWTTSIIFGSLWALWHLPLFFIKGYYHHQLWETNIIYVINFFVSVLAASILMNWIYFKNSRSIIAAILFHFFLDLFYVVFRIEPFTKCIATILMLIVVAFLVLQNKEFFFEKEENR
jgi:uncharacterized protein